MQKIYTMSNTTYKRILKLRNIERILCERCGKEIRPGMKIVAKLTSGSKYKYYHKECYESLWLDL